MATLLVPAESNGKKEDWLLNISLKTSLTHEPSPTVTQSPRQPQICNMEVNPGRAFLEASHRVLSQISETDEISWPLHLPFLMSTIKGMYDKGRLDS